MEKKSPTKNPKEKKNKPQGEFELAEIKLILVVILYSPK